MGKALGVDTSPETAMDRLKAHDTGIYEHTEIIGSSDRGREGFIQFILQLGYHSPSS